MARLFYERIPVEENKDPLVDIADYPFVGEPVYFRQGLSDTPRMFMRRAVADKLRQIQETSLRGLRFKIWDAWRPRFVQAAIYTKYWDDFKALHPDWGDERLRDELKVYVSPPDTPGRILQHATGGSVDLTLVDAATSVELNMGTSFDHLGVEAAPDYFEDRNDNLVARDNRRLLITAMQAEGFTVDPDEWWHFDYGNQKWAEQVGRDVAFYGEVLQSPIALIG